MFWFRREVAWKVVGGDVLAEGRLASEALAEAVTMAETTVLRRAIIWKLGRALSDPMVRDRVSKKNGRAGGRG